MWFFSYAKRKMFWKITHCALFANYILSCLNFEVQNRKYVIITFYNIEKTNKNRLKTKISCTYLTPINFVLLLKLKKKTTVKTWTTLLIFLLVFYRYRITFSGYTFSNLFMLENISFLFLYQNYWKWCTKSS